MPRIIAGRAAGIVLAAAQSGTRPTTDRVRESLFAALESAGALAGARVVDLYAGTGALGLEAISRGAASAALVEHSASAITGIRGNIDRVLKAMAGDIGADSIRVHRQSVGIFASAARGPFDLVFLDPPYDLGDGELDRVLEALEGSVAPGALVVVERGARSADPEIPADWALERTKRYGDTALRWYRVGEARSDEAHSDGAHSGGAHSGGAHSDGAHSDGAHSGGARAEEDPQPRDESQS